MPAGHSQGQILEKPVALAQVFRDGHREIPYNHLKGFIVSIIKRNNSSVWYIQFQYNGKPYIKSSKTTDKKAATQMETDWKSKLHAEQHLGQKERITLKAAMAQFAESKVGTPNHRGLHSAIRIVTRLMATGKPLDEVTSHDLERFKRDRMNEGTSGQTIRHNLNLVRGAWKHAAKLGYRVGELNFPEVKVGKAPLKYLSDEDEKKLLACLEPQRYAKRLPPWEERDPEIKRMMQDAYDLVVMLLDTGARYSEIANIEWTRIDMEERTIHLWRPKVQNEAILYMTDRVFSILERRKQSATGQYVFRNKKGGPRGYSGAAIRKALRKAGLDDCKIHTLRHTHASRLIQNGMSVYEVREVLGHTDIKTTMRYAHLETRQVTSKARDVINRLNQKAV
jgi:integrase